MSDIISYIMPTAVDADESGSIVINLGDIISLFVTLLVLTSLTRLPNYITFSDLPRGFPFLIDYY